MASCTQIPWYDGMFCIPTTIGDKDSRTQRQLAKFKNWRTFQNIFVRCIEKALARYDIEGYPDTVSGRFLREALLYYGGVEFFKLNGHVLALPGLPQGDPTAYRDYRKTYCFAANGDHYDIVNYIKGDASPEVLKSLLGIDYGEPTGVWVRENQQQYPFILECIEAAEKIADAYRVLDIMRHHMKIPYILVAEEQVIPTVKKTMNDIDDNVDYIVSSGIFPVDKIQAIPLQVAPDAFKATTDLIEWYWNDFDNKCNFNSNSNPDKKERLLVDEVNANNETTDQVKIDFFDFLNEQLEFANECMGTDMKAVQLKGDEHGDVIPGLDQDAGRQQMAAAGVGGKTYNGALRDS